MNKWSAANRRVRSFTGDHRPFAGSASTGPSTRYCLSCGNAPAGQ